MPNMILSFLPVVVAPETKISTKIYSQLSRSKWPRKVTLQPYVWYRICNIKKKNKACLIVIIITMNNCLILCLRFLSVILSIKISLILRSFLLFCYITDVNEYWNQIFENFKFCLTHIGPNISENKTVL